MALIILNLLSLYAVLTAGDDLKRPNIVFIVGDDIGWNDISLHGSDQILTPNIDTLGYQGVIISKYYTDCQGTPSRSALFTGKYPMRMGTQGPSIEAGEDRGIPLSERLLPLYLKDLGYVSHLVGKWQLGKSREHFLPMNRGFDTFYGFTDGSVDYFTYNHMMTFNGTDYYGLDLFHNFKPVQSQSGDQKHLTSMLTDHAVKLIKEHNTSAPLYLHMSHAAAHIGGGMVNLQASLEDVTANSHIAHSARRTYAGLVTGVDRSTGSIVAALNDKNILNNTFIIFVSDNGAQSVGVSRNFGSNLPLRGTKGSPWEGAVRSTALLWHASIDSKIWNGLFHVTDWLPTLLTAVGGNIPKNLDGVNQWNSIVNDEIPKRHHAIIAVDDLNEWGAFRDGDLKLIVGSVPNTCGYYGKELNKVISYGAPVYKDKLPTSLTWKVFKEKMKMDLDIDHALKKRDLCNLNSRKSRSNDTTLEGKEICVPTKVRGCLFNISADPEESNDLWNKFPEVVLYMTLRFRYLWSELVPRRPPSFDLRANPVYYGYTWHSWLKNDYEEPAPVTAVPRLPTQVTDAELEYFVSLNLDVFRKKFSNYMKNMADNFIEGVSSLLTA